MTVKRSHVVVVGGGVVGLAVCYYLTKRSIRATLVERSKIASEASYGNAGLVAPDLSTPFSSYKEGREMFWRLLNAQPEGPRGKGAARDFLELVSRSFVEVQGKRGKAMRRALRGLAKASLGLYRELSKSEGLKFEFEEKGLLYPFKDHSQMNSAMRWSDEIRKDGSKFKELEGSEALELEPSLSRDVKGALYFPNNAQLYSPELAQELFRASKERGGEIFQETEVLGFEAKGGRIEEVRTTRGKIVCDEVVLASGPWTKDLANLLGAKVPVEPGRGHTIALTLRKKKMRTAVNLRDKGFAVVQYSSGRVRVSGIVEFVGYDKGPNESILKWMLQEARSMVPSLLLSRVEERWSGLRPFTPDGLPMIGRLEGHGNAIVSTGHGQLGVTLAPITGKLVAELIDGGRTSFPLDEFDPMRFTHKT